VHSGPSGDAWLATEDASVPVLTMLYLRDALGIVDPGGPPRLDATGLPEVGPPGLRMGWAWTRWWISTIESDRPDFASLPDLDDEWAGVVRRHLDSARAWAQVAHQVAGERAARRHDLTLPDVVHERERELGRRARAFRLRIEVLPLAEPGLWWIGESAIAVDETVRAEPVLYADALRPVIEQLA
jgi:hypothetical protein